ncbi:MAG TPA: hypothetical protein VGX03_11885 [Candidatus Binatia bacterium]|jgi:hypothetical protein|nr:hypothetical protein [Candidatus Binatia bacterium]
MADARRIIEIIFGARDETSSVVAGLGDRFGDFSDKVETATQPLADFTVGLLKFEAAAAAGAVALAGFAIKASGDFD